MSCCTLHRRSCGLISCGLISPTVNEKQRPGRSGGHVLAERATPDAYTKASRRHLAGDTVDFTFTFSERRTDVSDELDFVSADEVRGTFAATTEATSLMMMGWGEP